MSQPVAIFERVEPPLWPWTGPSGRVYDYHKDHLAINQMGEGKMNSIAPEDFAGLAERLQKQAEMNQ